MLDLPSAGDFKSAPYEALKRVAIRGTATKVMNLFILSFKKL